MGGIDKLFSTPKLKIPEQQPAVRLPTPDSPEAVEARKRKIAEQQSKSGRQSTILANGSPPPYVNSLLGQ